MKKTLVKIYIYLFLAVFGAGLTIFFLKLVNKPCPELFKQITGLLAIGLIAFAYAFVMEYLIKAIFQNQNLRCFLINPGEKFANKNIHCSIFWKNKPRYIIRHFKIAQPQYNPVFWNCYKINADEFYLAILIMPKQKLIFNMIWSKDLHLLSYWTEEAKNCRRLCIFKVPGFYLEKPAEKPVFIYQFPQHTFKKTQEYLRIENKLQYHILKLKSL